MLEILVPGTMCIYLSYEESWKSDSVAKEFIQMVQNLFTVSRKPFPIFSLLVWNVDTELAPSSTVKAPLGCSSSVCVLSLSVVNIAMSKSISLETITKQASSYIKKSVHVTFNKRHFFAKQDTTRAFEKLGVIILPLPPRNNYVNRNFFSAWSWEGHVKYDD